MQNNVTDIRDGKGRFVKGVSGNPHGVSKEKKALNNLTKGQEALLQSMFVAMVPDARDALSALLKRGKKGEISDDNLIRVINLVLSYGIGKPTQQIVQKVETDDAGLGDVSPAMREAMLKALTEQKAADDARK